jgi:hypothetical protein
MISDDSELKELFQDYRSACPDVEPSANFMPALWQKIESRHSFWFVFQRFGRSFMTASAALCLLLLVLNFVSANGGSVSLWSFYTDALMDEHTAEETYYTEAIHNPPASYEASGSVQQ